MQPDTSVDDVLGDLMAVESQNSQDEGRSGGEDYYNFHGGDALLPHDELDHRSMGGGSETMPETAGAPKILGPQLCLDAEGNMVLDQSSLSKIMEDDGPMQDGPIRDLSVTEYKEAYRRTPRTNWTEQEHTDFYRALRLYGTDLFLVQTFFRNKSAAQVKSKYSREMKKHPEKMHQALTEQAERLTKDVFESLHGKIDTSK